MLPMESPAGYTNQFCNQSPTLNWRIIIIIIIIIVIIIISFLRVFHTSVKQMGFHRSLCQ